MFRYRGAEARDLIGSCVCRVVRDEILGNVDRKVQRSKSRGGIPFEEILNSILILAYIYIS